MMRFCVVVRGSIVGWRDDGGMARARERMREAGIARSEIHTVRMHGAIPEVEAGIGAFLLA
jgi:hypothetical protein